MHPVLSRDVIEQLMSQVVECAANGVGLTMLDGRIVLARFLSEYRAAALSS
jgi:hypothetical protein